MTLPAIFPAPPKSLCDLARAYLQRPLDSFFAYRTNRSLLYYRLGLYLLLAALAGKVLSREHDFLVAHLDFYFTYALLLSLTYLVGAALAEGAVHYLAPRWSAYDQRTVARQWLIWGLGLVFGLLTHRLSGPWLVSLYAPWLINFIEHMPQGKPSEWEIVLFCAAVWSVASFGVIQIALAWQKRLRRRQALAAMRPEDATPAPAAEAPSRPVPAFLTVSHDGRRSKILVERITHVTVEDHYCRIHFLHGDGPRSVFVCMTLKSLAEELPDGEFAQIHRSHLVNLRHVAGLNRSGRRYFAELTGAGAELPISRHRWAELQERLPEVKPAN